MESIIEKSSESERSSFRGKLPMKKREEQGYEETNYGQSLQGGSTLTRNPFGSEETSRVQPYEEDSLREQFLARLLHGQGLPQAQAAEQNTQQLEVGFENKNRQKLMQLLTEHFFKEGINRRLRSGYGTQLELHMYKHKVTDEEWIEFCNNSYYKNFDLKKRQQVCGLFRIGSAFRNK